MHRWKAVHEHDDILAQLRAQLDGAREDRRVAQLHLDDLRELLQRVTARHAKVHLDRAAAACHAWDRLDRWDRIRRIAPRFHERRRLAQLGHVAQRDADTWQLEADEAGEQLERTVQAVKAREARRELDHVLAQIKIYNARKEAGELAATWKEAADSLPARREREQLLRDVDTLSGELIGARKAYDTAQAAWDDAVVLQARRELELDRWEGVIQAREDRDKHRERMQRIRGLRNRLQEVAGLLGGGEATRVQADSDLARSRSIQRFKGRVQDRLRDVRFLADAMDRYRVWLYRDCVVPNIVALANDIAATLNPRQNVQLRGFVGDDALIRWRIASNGEVVPPYKASGFQRFCVGLAARIALAQISPQRCDQLLLDEGFVACDHEHLAQVPDMMRGLLGRYKGILLVSHLPLVQDIADVVIEIQRRGPVSTLVYGNGTLVPYGGKKEIGRGGTRGRHVRGLAAT